MLSSLALNMTIGETAKAIGRFLDGGGDPSRAVTAAQLEAYADRAEQAPPGQREWFILPALQRSVSPVDVDRARSLAGAIAQDLRRWHTDTSPAWHPYLAILEEPPIQTAHPGHYQVIMRHGAWYQQEMDAALDWLFPGTADGKAQR